MCKTHKKGAGNTENKQRYGSRGGHRKSVI